jgi:hypothetical protein
MALLQTLKEIKSAVRQGGLDALRKVVFGQIDPTPKTILEKIVPAGIPIDRIETLAETYEQRRIAAADLQTAAAMQPECDAAQLAHRESAESVEATRKRHREEDEAVLRAMSEASSAHSSLTYRQRELRTNALDTLKRTADPAINAAIAERRQAIETWEGTLRNLEWNSGVNTAFDAVRGKTVDVAAHREETRTKGREAIDRLRSEIADLERSKLVPENMALD